MSQEYIFCRHFCDSISWAIVSRQVNFYKFLLDIIDFVLFPYHLKPEFYSSQDYIEMTLFWNMIVFESGLYSSEVYYCAYLSLLHRSGLDLYKCLLCPTTKWSNHRLKNGSQFYGFPISIGNKLSVNDLFTLFTPPC